MKNFALLGVGGYIAPRHLAAIKETGNVLLASLDKHDSVGVLDSYFPNSNFFIEFERFDRYIEKLKREQNVKLDYVSICTPNYLHDSHIRMALRRGANVICEKPLVLNPWNLDALVEIEKESRSKINAILQLRLHPSILALKKRVELEKKKEKYNVDLKYITSRGNWYDFSWKGDKNKSGGLETNIGIHFFDMLSWVFGDVQENKVYEYGKHTVSGYLELEKACVNWTLSISQLKLPDFVVKMGGKTFRSISVDGEEVEFSSGFTDLHLKSYQEILKGNGFGIEDARKSIEIVSQIRNSNI